MLPVNVNTHTQNPGALEVLKTMVWLGGLDVWEVAAHQCLGPAWLEEAGRQDRLAAMASEGAGRPPGRTGWMPWC